MTARLNFYLACYDVASDRKRTRVLARLKAHGRRVQRSVVECHLGEPDLRALLTEFRELIDDEDEVAFYRCCRSCRAVTRSTVGRRPDEIPRYIVV